VRRREPAALAALFDRHFGNVFGLVCHLIGDRTAAEDVTHDVFLKVYRSAHQLDPARDPGAWLTAIATNACRDRWRSGAYRMAQRSGPVEDVPESGLALTRGTNDPEDDALAAERERLVQGAIGRLPEALRVPVVLHDYQGLSHQEIAEILGVNHAAARKRYSRALAALAGLLSDTLGERRSRDHA
jgi:RNA polymerase sigma-70 factor (ECF subfamily)